MNQLSFPTVRPFEVWYQPDDGVRLSARVPLRIGQRLSHYDDAVILAEAAARELPAYGISDGSVVVLWSSSVLKVLNMVRLPRVPLTSDGGPTRLPPDTPSIDVVRLVLEDLRQLASLSDPNQAVCPAWIERLHAVLRRVASPEDQVRYRLDGLHEVTMDLLYRRVIDILNRIDQLTTDSGPPLRKPAQPATFAPRID